MERLPGGVYTSWKAPPFHGAHPLLPLEPPSPQRKQAVKDGVKVTPNGAPVTVTVQQYSARPAAARGFPMKRISFIDVNRFPRTHAC